MVPEAHVYFKFGPNINDDSLKNFIGKRISDIETATGYVKSIDIFGEGKEYDGVIIFKTDNKQETKKFVKEVKEVKVGKDKGVKNNSIHIVHVDSRIRHFPGVGYDVDRDL